VKGRGVGAAVVIAMVAAIVAGSTVEAALSAPALSSPSDGATEQPTTPTLNWSLVPGAMSYQLQVSTTSNFYTTVVNADSLLITYYTVGVLESALSPNTTYYWHVRAKNLTDTSSWSSTWSFTTTGPLTISNVQVTNVTTNSATINWTTNLSSTGTVTYGTTKPPLATSPDLTSTTTHSVNLTPLLSNTTYYFKIDALSGVKTATADNSGNYYVFTTAAETALTISNVQVTNVTWNSAVVSWSTNIESSGTVYYGISPTSVITPVVSLNLGAKSHSVNLIGLLQKTTYYFKISARVGLQTYTDDNGGAYYKFTTTGIGTVVKEGASFGLPQTIENKITSYVNMIPQSVLDLIPIPIPRASFLMASGENISLVLSKTSDKGIARVEGWALTQPITIENVSLDVILADNVTFTKEGQSVSMSEILSNPSQYYLKLVKISATRRQVSVLLKIDDGIELPLTVGYLVENPKTTSEIVQNAISVGKDFIENTSAPFINNMMKLLDEKRICIFDFETDYWIDAPAVTNGIVITSGPIIQALKQIFPGSANFVQLDPNIPVIYDVKTDLTYQNASSVKEITDNPSGYTNKVVGLTVNEFGGSISIREAIKNLILDIPVDVVLEGSVNWNDLSVPPQTEEILLAAGASSTSQNQIVSAIQGRYLLVGRIVTAKQIDQSLPEVPLLLIYHKEKVGDIDWTGLADQIKTFIENELGKLNWALSSFSSEPISGLTVTPPPNVSIAEYPSGIPSAVLVAEKVEYFIKTITSETPLELNLENTAVAQVSVKFKQACENAAISFEKIESQALSIPPPPENFYSSVYCYFEVTLRVPADTVQEASLTFGVSKEFLQNLGADKKDVLLLRYSGGTWENLQTTFENENQTHFLYSAETPGFSVFAVSVKAQASPPSAVAGGLPISLVVAIVVCGVIGSIGVIFYKARKRKSV